MPTQRTNTIKELTKSLQGIASGLLDKAAKEKVEGIKEGEGDKSIIGALGKLTFPQLEADPTWRSQIRNREFEHSYVDGRDNGTGGFGWGLLAEFLHC